MNDTLSSILSSIKQITDIEPNVYFGDNDNSSIIFVSFKNGFPDEETVQKIYNILKEFGNFVLYNLHYSNVWPLMFMILK